MHSLMESFEYVKLSHENKASDKFYFVCQSNHVWWNQLKYLTESSAVAFHFLEFTSKLGS